MRDEAGPSAWRLGSWRRQHLHQKYSRWAEAAADLNEERKGPPESERALVDLMEKGERNYSKFHLKIEDNGYTIQLVQLPHHHGAHFHLISFVYSFQ